MVPMSLELGGRNPDRSFLMISLKSPRFIARLSTSNFLSVRLPERYHRKSKNFKNQCLPHDQEWPAPFSSLDAGYKTKRALNGSSCWWSSLEQVGPFCLIKRTTTTQTNKQTQNVSVVVCFLWKTERQP